MKREYLKNDGAQSRFDDDRLESITKLGELAQENGCSFIVMAGDIFEYPSGEKNPIDRACEKLRSVPVPVYLLPGNHDYLSQKSVLLEVEKRVSNCYVLKDAQPIEVPSPDGESLAQVIGAPLTVRHPDRDLVADAVSGLEATGQIRIVVGHGQPVSKSFGSNTDNNRIDIDALRPLFDGGVIDYVALGDTHSTEEIAEGVWFSGSPEATDFRKADNKGEYSKGESDSGNALIVEIEKHSGQRAEVMVTKKHLGRWRFEELRRNLNSQEDVEDFLSYLSNWQDKDRSVVKCILEGELPMSARGKLFSGIEEIGRLFAGLYERGDFKHLGLQPTDEELENIRISGFAKEALQELLRDSRDRQKSEEERAVAQKAALMLWDLWKNVEEG